MLGTPKYPRNALDFYPTPKRAVESLLTVIGDDIPSFLVWEPFCGNGAVTNVIKDEARDIVSTDIRAYEGFDPDGLFDFFELKNLDPITALKGFTPDAIITNPPYGDLAEAAAEHAIHLMQPQNGIVIFFCRHEWDTAKGRAHLFDHPAFAMKIVLRHRPRWIEGSKGAPRHSYAFYVWNWQKPASARPEILYVK